MRPDLTVNVPNCRIECAWHNARNDCLLSDVGTDIFEPLGKNQILESIATCRSLMPKTSKIPAKEPVDELSWPKISLKQNVEVEVVEPEQIIVLDVSAH
jgi:hypothetical protein